MAAYHDALKRANKAGSSKADDAGLMAQFCNTALMTLVGAASPQLVWEGAQKRGMTTLQLAKLCNTDHRAVHDLMWE